MSVKIKTNYQLHEPLGENFEKDATWLSNNRLSLYEEYGDCVLLVYHEQVIGTGADVPAAVADAERRLSDKEGIITPVVKYQSSPYRIGIRQK